MGVEGEGILGGGTLGEGILHEDVKYVLYAEIGQDMYISKPVSTKNTYLHKK